MMSRRLHQGWGAISLTRAVVNRLKALSDGLTLAEYYIAQPEPAAKPGLPKASWPKISSIGSLVTTTEQQSLLIL